MCLSPFAAGIHTAFLVQDSAESFVALLEASDLLLMLLSDSFQLHILFLQQGGYALQLLPSIFS